MDFTAVYERHASQVFGFFAYRLPSYEAAEDLTQLTFERALRAWERYDPARGSTATWLLAIARNLLIDNVRADRTGRQLSLDHADHVAASPTPPRLGLDAELAAGLAHLAHRDRELLALRFGADMTGSQIAELTGLSLSNVQQILSRSLRELRRVLEPERDEAP